MIGLDGLALLGVFHKLCHALRGRGQRGEQCLTKCDNVAVIQHGRDGIFDSSLRKTARRLSCSS